MAADVCECGHLDVPTHTDGPCRMWGCDCAAFQSEDDEAGDE